MLFPKLLFSPSGLSGHRSRANLRILWAGFSICSPFSTMYGAVFNTSRLLIFAVFRCSGKHSAICSYRFFISIPLLLAYLYLYGQPLGVRYEYHHGVDQNVADLVGQALFRREYDPVRPFGSCEDLGLYVHIPFCRGLRGFRSYCKKVYEPERCRRYLDTLIWEIHQIGGQYPSKKQVTSLYFGNGRPQVAPA